MPGPLSATSIRTWPASRRRADPNGTAVGCVPNRVVEEIAQDLDQGVPVGAEPECLSGFPASSVICLLFGTGCRDVHAASTRSSMDCSPGSGVQTPDSMRDRSRRSSIRACIRSTFARMRAVNSVACSSGSSPSASASAKPRRLVIGVFSSCDTLATKSRRTPSSWRVRVTSWMATRAPSSSGSAERSTVRVPSSDSCLDSSPASADSIASRFRGSRNMLASRCPLIPRRPTQVSNAGFTLRM